MTSGLDLPMFYQLSYEASTGAGRGNLDSESRYVFKCPSPPLLAFPREKWEKGKKQQEGES